MTFGVTDKCNHCKTGDFEFKKNGYRCNGKFILISFDYFLLESSIGDVSEWAMCDNYIEKPQRHELVLPKNWKLEWDAWHFKPILQDRAIRPLVLSFNWTKEAKSMKLDDAVISELVASPHVDPKSKMETRTHVYKKDSILYSVVLTITDIQRNKNSYYKMQLLEENCNKKYHIFTSWGRIGTQKIGSAIKTILGNSAAIDYFEELYKKKTQNSWNLNRTPEFQKKPGCYVPIDLHDTETEQLINEPVAPSQLPVQLQDLIKMMFDVNSMKQTMKEFMLDLSKVNPGRLKRKQLEEANQCLAGLFMLVENGGRNAEFIGLSNKFYTLIPHAFGTDTIPVIDTIETIREKSDMIESLLEIETAHSMMYAERYSAISPIDFQYAQLMNQLTPLDRKTEEFELIEQYLQNTHGDTHTLYRLEIQEVFKVDRFGESKRYEPWQNMHNRTLLWHGSRLTNFVGILSHGLKIAPPEAPPRSHMFGKGIYFADMVTKSANYCNPDYPSMLRNTSGLLLLCEVALGNMQHLTKAKTIVSLPQHVHSIMGLGRMIPEPSLAYTRKDGVTIPLGKPKKRLLSDLYPLYYNEFIVYNESQVKIQYLLKVFFRPVA